MNEWRSVESFVEFSTKGVTPKYVEKSRTLVLNQKCIRNHKIDYSFARYISDDQKIAAAKYVKPGDILFNSTGQGTAGRCAFVKDLPEEVAVVIDSHILILRCSTFHEAQCLSYALYSFEETLQSFMDGSTGQAELDKVRVFNLWTKIPNDDGAQKKIAAVLSALDEKIELNNRINSELEAMTKTLYDYWFVQFDFPAANGRPYKSSGGKMVYNKKLKREIPEGWDGSSILAVADIFGGGTPSKKKKEYWSGDIPFFTPTDADSTVYKFAAEDYITEEGLKKSSTKLFDKNTVLITARGSVGKLVLTGVKMAMNQSCYALRAKDEISYTFLYHLTKELIHHLAVKSSGSVFNSIVSSDIEYTNLAIPVPKVIQRYGEVAEPIFRRIANNTRENYELAELRDWLLPMLMNGQVQVA